MASILLLNKKTNKGVNNLLFSIISFVPFPKISLASPPPVVTLLKTSQQILLTALLS